MRQVEHEHLDAGQHALQGPDPVGVRAVAVAGHKGVLVEPNQVPALGVGIAVEAACNQDARPLEVRGQRGRLAAAALLARVEQDRAAVGNEHRVEDVDRVRVPFSWFGKDDLGARPLEGCAKTLVLVRDRNRVGLAAPAAAPPAVRASGRPQEDAPKLSGHRHADDRTSASRRSRKVRSAGCAASSSAR